jgi:hypothetical protein
VGLQQEWPSWPRTHNGRLHPSTRRGACWQGHCEGCGWSLDECCYHRCVLSLSLFVGSRLGPAEGVLYMWGRNHVCHLGLGDTEDRLTPTVVSSLSGRRVVDVVSSSDHTVAVTGAWRVYVCSYVYVTPVSVDADGVSSVMAWGANNFGSLGIGTTSGSLSVPDEDYPDLPYVVEPSPVEVASLRARRVLALSGHTAFAFTMALLSPSDADREEE